MKLDQVSRAHQLAAWRELLAKNQDRLAGKKVTQITLSMDAGDTVGFSTTNIVGRVLVRQMLLDEVRGIFAGELDRLIAACEAELKQLGVEIEPKTAGLRVVSPKGGEPA